MWIDLTFLYRRVAIVLAIALAIIGATVLTVLFTLTSPGSKARADRTRNLHSKEGTTWKP